MNRRDAELKRREADLKEAEAESAFEAETIPSPTGLREQYSGRRPNVGTSAARTWACDASNSVFRRGFPAGDHVLGPVGGLDSIEKDQDGNFFVDEPVRAVQAIDRLSPVSLASHPDRGGGHGERKHFEYCEKIVVMDLDAPVLKRGRQNDIERLNFVDPKMPRIEAFRRVVDYYGCTMGCLSPLSSIGGSLAVGKGGMHINTVPFFCSCA